MDASPTPAAHAPAQTAQFDQQPGRGSRGFTLPWVLIALLGLALLVRLPGLSRPLVGNFATKNAIYAMIARNWALDRSPAWLPAVDCIHGGHRGWHLLEVPVSAYLAGLSWKLFGGSLDAWGRAVSVIFSLSSVLLMYLLVRRWHGPTAAAAAAAVLAFSPVSIVYGQSFMLEASLVTFTLATIWCLDHWLSAWRLAWLGGSALALCMAALTKIYILIFLAPLCLMAYRGTRALSGAPRRRARLLACVAAILALSPAICWCAMAMRLGSPDHPLASRVYYSLRDSASDHPLPHPLLASPDFYRQLIDDLAGPVLTPIGLMMLFAGFANPSWRRHIAWLAGLAALVVLLPAKFHAMNYYHLAVLPAWCLVAALGWQVIVERLRPKGVLVGGLLAAGLLFSLRHAVGPAFKTPDEDRSVAAAGRALDAMAPAGEGVIAVHGTSPDLLYYCNRPGWVLSAESDRFAARLDDARRLGARWLVVAGADSMSRTVQIRAGQTPALRGRDFAIYRLPAPAGASASTAARAGGRARR